jgi:hypothetical protein
MDGGLAKAPAVGAVAAASNRNPRPKICGVYLMTRKTLLSRGKEVGTTKKTYHIIKFYSNFYKI